ncbi:hypothetical protein ANN_19395 [Periplaneta americana]|uniref:ATP synthase subunit gamma n=1 Tax=Periplaneta americana TaxID=6978 RepID=A0ABQ8SAB5_PERAM|nr:hypothetical protein ANN_19395 [Periplaneta americana]
MATLKSLAAQIKSLKNIGKITKSMRMVSASKFSKAQLAVKDARVFGEAAEIYYERAEIRLLPGTLPENLYIAMTSDRGLCGAANAQICRYIKDDLKQHRNELNHIICVGVISRNTLKFEYAEKISLVVDKVGAKPYTFLDASKLASSILTMDEGFNNGKIVFNELKSVTSYRTIATSIYSLATVFAAPKMNFYDNLDPETVQSFFEFSLTCLLYRAMVESSASEHSARLIAMENASRNAEKVKNKVSVQFNRNRQAAITKELTEIVSGATAVNTAKN